MHGAGTNTAVVGGAVVVAGAAVVSGGAVVTGSVVGDSEPVPLSVSRRKRKYTRAKISTMTTTTMATTCTVLGLELVDGCWFRLASDGGGCGWSLMRRHILVKTTFAGETVARECIAFNELAFNPDRDLSQTVASPMRILEVRPAAELSVR